MFDPTNGETDRILATQVDIENDEYFKRHEAEPK